MNPIALTDEQLPIYAILTGGKRKWITKAEAMALAGLKDDAFDALVKKRIIISNDRGSGKVIHYRYDSIEKYLDNPTKAKDQTNESNN